MPGTRAGLAEGVLLITDDCRGIASAFAERLRALGREVALVEVGEDAGQIGPGRYRCSFAGTEAVEALASAVRVRQGAVAAIVHLLPVRETPVDLDLSGWQRRLAEDVEGMFHLAQAFAADLHQAARGDGAAFLAVSGMGGTLGFGESSFFPGGGGVLGLAKTLAQEWPDIRSRGVDIDSGDDAGRLAERLVEELFVADDTPEVGYDGARRVTVAVRPAPFEQVEGLKIDPSWVILLTGGARGITADMAIELARRYRPTLLLAGRSPYPSAAEDPATASATTPQELKAAILARMRAEDRAPVPVEVEKEFRRISAEREIRETLRAIDASGAIGRYFQVDVRDEQAMRRFLESVYEHYRRVDGVVHGAGVIEDKLIERKDPASFRRVFGTKADSAFVLTRLLRFDQLQFLAFFSSVSGRYGNRGQGDYAAANEVLNKLAQRLDREHATRVVAINWGPWATGGMVSPELHKKFAERGVYLIPREVGVRLCDRELRLGSKGEAEVVVAGGTWLEPKPPTKNGAAPLAPLFARPGATIERRADGSVAAVVRLDLETDRHLHDHVIDGQPVLPAAMGQELMAEVAQAGWPELALIRLHKTQMLKGVVFDEPGKTLRVLAQPERQTAAGLLVQVEVFSETPTRRVHYRMTAELGPAVGPSAAPELPPLVNPRRYPMTLAETYQRILFHGSMWAGLAGIDTLADNGLEGWMRPSSPTTLLAGPVTGSWVMDPLVFDSQLQLTLILQRLTFDTTPLPGRYGTLHRYGAPDGGPLRCRLVMRPNASPSMYLADAMIWNKDGRPLWYIEGMECPSSKALNRLADQGPSHSPIAGRP